MSWLLLLVPLLLAFDGTEIDGLQATANGLIVTGTAVVVLIGGFKVGSVAFNRIQDAISAHQEANYAPVRADFDKESQYWRYLDGFRAQAAFNGMTLGEMYANVGVDVSDPNQLGNMHPMDALHVDMWGSTADSPVPQGNPDRFYAASPDGKSHR